jgi:molecular chaperone GrpE
MTNSEETNTDNENELDEHDMDQDPKSTQENDLNAKLQDAYEQNETIHNKYLRALADLENIRKRSIREREESATRAKTQIFIDLLPILDAFSLGLAQAEKAKGEKEVVQGFAMAMIQFKETMKSYGLEIIDPSTGNFDPGLHEAIGYEEAEGVENGTILKTIRTGYKLKEKLLRPASVILVKNGSVNTE